VLAESQTTKPVSARGLLLTDDKVLVISPCFFSSVLQQSLLSTFELKAVLVSKVAKNRTKLNVSG